MLENKGAFFFVYLYTVRAAFFMAPIRRKRVEKYVCMLFVGLYSIYTVFMMALVKRTRI